MKPLPFMAVAYAIGLLLSVALFGCYHGSPPTPTDPTAPPPAVTLPTDPLAPPFTPLYRHSDGGTDR